MNIIKNKQKQSPIPKIDLNKIRNQYNNANSLSSIRQNSLANLSIRLPQTRNTSLIKIGKTKNLSQLSNDEITKRSSIFIIKSQWEKNSIVEKNISGINGTKKRVRRDLMKSLPLIDRSRTHRPKNSKGFEDKLKIPLTQIKIQSNVVNTLNNQLKIPIQNNIPKSSTSIIDLNHIKSNYPKSLLNIKPKSTLRKSKNKGIYYEFQKIGKTVPKHILKKYNPSGNKLLPLGNNDPYDVDVSKYALYPKNNATGGRKKISEEERIQQIQFKRNQVEEIRQMEKEIVYYEKNKTFKDEKLRQKVFNQYNQEKIDGLNNMNLIRKTSSSRNLTAIDEINSKDQKSEAESNHDDNIILEEMERLVKQFSKNQTFNLDSRSLKLKEEKNNEVVNESEETKNIKKLVEQKSKVMNILQAHEENNKYKDTEYEWLRREKETNDKFIHDLQILNKKWFTEHDEEMFKVKKHKQWRTAKKVVRVVQDLRKLGYTDFQIRGDDTLLPLGVHLMEKSPIFIAAVKARNLEKVKKMVRKENNLVYQYDYVRLIQI